MADRDQPAAAVVDLGQGSPDPVLLGLLERLSQRRPELPAFVLHSDDDLASRVELARLGVAGVLPRSMAPAAVVGSVERTLPRRAAARSRVIALDDDPSILDALEALLSPEGVDVVGVEDPEALWELLRGVPPDLIVLDVDMPAVSGIDLCRVLRADPRFQELPVLFLSARLDGESLRRMFGAGADDYVAKPIVASELVGRIRNRIGARPPPARAGRPGCADRHPRTVARRAPSWRGCCCWPTATSNRSRSAFWTSTTSRRSTTGTAMPQETPSCSL